MKSVLLATLAILLPSAAVGAENPTHCYAVRHELVGNGRPLGRFKASASIANDVEPPLVSFSVSMPESGQILADERLVSKRIAPHTYEFRFLDGWGNHGKGLLAIVGKHANLILKPEKVEPSGTNILRNYGNYTLALSHCDVKTPPEVALVSRLYRHAAQETVGRGQRPRQPTFMDQSMEVLLQYLDPELVHLLMADRACVEKSATLCKLDFSPIWASQDPTGASARIQPGKRPGNVDVSLRYPTGQDISLRFEVTDTPSGPRIHDIHYAKGPSLLAILNSTY